jgi:hypothetical protein
MIHLGACFIQHFKTSVKDLYTFSVVPSMINSNSKMCCSTEQHAFKNGNNCQNTNIYSYLRDIWWSKFSSTFKCC